MGSASSRRHLVLLSFGEDDSSVFCAFYSWSSISYNLDTAVESESSRSSTDRLPLLMRGRVAALVLRGFFLVLKRHLLKVFHATSTHSTICQTCVAVKSRLTMMVQIAQKLFVSKVHGRGQRVTFATSEKHFLLPLYTVCADPDPSAIWRLVLSIYQALRAFR